MTVRSAYSPALGLAYLITLYASLRTALAFRPIFTEHRIPTNDLVNAVA